MELISNRGCGFIMAFLANVVTCAPLVFRAFDAVGLPRRLVVTYFEGDPEPPKSGIKVIMSVSRANQGYNNATTDVCIHMDPCCTANTENQKHARSNRLSPGKLFGLNITGVQPDKPEILTVLADSISIDHGTSYGSLSELQPGTLSIVAPRRSHIMNEVVDYTDIMPEMPVMMEVSKAMERRFVRNHSSMVGMGALKKHQAQKKRETKQEYIVDKITQMCLVAEEQGKPPLYADGYLWNHILGGDQYKTHHDIIQTTSPNILWPLFQQAERQRLSQTRQTLTFDQVKAVVKTFPQPRFMPTLHPEIGSDDEMLNVARKHMLTTFKDREIEVVERDEEANVTKTMTCAEFIESVPTTTAWYKKGAENLIRIYPGPHGTTVHDYIRFCNFYRHAPRPDVANEATLAKVKLTVKSYLGSGGGNSPEGDMPITTLADIKRSTLPNLYKQLSNVLATSTQRPELLVAALDVTTPPLWGMCCTQERLLYRNLQRLSLGCPRG